MISEEQKAEAIRRIVTSTGFHRSDVLKALLEYLCRQEGQGRAHEVTEYEIATKALGRPADFAPETDSSVRTRVLALRKKLDEYYADEGHGTEIRIEIPRGTYALRFAPVTVEAKPTAEVAPIVPAAKPAGMKVFLAGGLAGMILLAAVGAGWLWLSRRGGPAADPELERAWGPMVARGAAVSIVVGTPASLFIRDFGSAQAPLGDPGYRLDVPRDPAFAEWYQRTRNQDLGKTAILHPNAHSPLWGDAAAASILSRVFGAAGASVEVLPGGRVHPVALRGKNAVIIGRPEYTDAARALRPDDGLSVEYNPEKRAMGVQNRTPNAGEPAWWFATGGLRHSYGLITVLSWDDATKSRTILLAGINSDGAEAGARFLTSPDKLADLGRRLAAAGYGQWPPRFQVVVRTESLDTYSLETKFEFLRVLK